MPHAMAAVHSCRRYMTAMADRGNCLREFVHPMTEIAAAEPEGSAERASWQILAKTADAVHPVYMCAVEVVQCGLFEHLSFLGGDCLQTAKETLDAARAAVISPTLQEAMRLDAAQRLGQEWDTCRMIRGCVMLEQLRGTAIELAAEVCK